LERVLRARVAKAYDTFRGDYYLMRIGYQGLTIHCFDVAIFVKTRIGEKEANSLWTLNLPNTLSQAHATCFDGYIALRFIRELRNLLERFSPWFAIVDNSWFASHIAS
jgi:hypothetical protein